MTRANRRAAWIWACVLVGAAGPAAAAGPCVATEQLFSCKFGVEQYEDGKRSRLRQLWELRCARAPTLGCALTTTIFAPAGEGDSTIMGAQYSTQSGGLVARGDPWSGGTLILEITRADAAPVSVTMRLTKPADGAPVELASFAATAPRRSGSKGAPVELRIPEETTTVQVPVILPGMRAGSAASRDPAMVGALSADDQKAYERFQKSGCLEKAAGPSDANLPGVVRERCGDEVMAALEGSAPETLTTPQLHCFAEALAGSFKDATRRCLAESGMSAKGQEHVLTLMAPTFDPDALVAEMQRNQRAGKGGPP